MGVSGTIMATAALVSAGTSIYSASHQPKAPAVPAAPNPAAEQVKADQAASTAASTQKRKTAGAKGYSSTILTSPQGVTAPAPVAAKTLLGS